MILAEERDTELQRELWSKNEKRHVMLLIIQTSDDEQDERNPRKSSTKNNPCSEKIKNVSEGSKKWKKLMMLGTVFALQGCGTGQEPAEREKETIQEGKWTTRVTQATLIAPRATNRQVNQLTNVTNVSKNWHQEGSEIKEDQEVGQEEWQRRRAIE